MQCKQTNSKGEVKNELCHCLMKTMFNENKFQAGKEGQIEALKVTEELSTRQRAVNDKQAINYKGGNMFEN